MNPLIRQIYTRFDANGIDAKLSNKTVSPLTSVAGVTVTVIQPPQWKNFAIHRKSISDQYVLFLKHFLGIKCKN